MNIIQVIINNIYPLTFLKANFIGTSNTSISAILPWRKKGKFYMHSKGKNHSKKDALKIS